jgi:membrane associated rhomboid family serine protease
MDHYKNPKLSIKNRFETTPLQLQRPFVPLCTYFLILMNITYFTFTTWHGVDWIEPSTQHLLDWGGNFTYLFFQGETWRIFSNIFVHAGVVHLVSNMIALYFLGKEFERLVGHRSFFIAYFGGGLIASINSMYWHNQEVMVGASGAIFAILGGLLAVIVTAEGRRIQRAQEKSGSIIQWMTFALISGFGSKNTDNAAHLGGLLSGFVLGLLLSRAYTAERLRFKIKPSWRTLAVVSVMAVYFALPFYFKPPPFNQFIQWYTIFETDLIKQVQVVDMFPTAQAQKDHWHRTLKSKFKHFDDYFDQFIDKINHKPNSAPGVYALLDSKATQLSLVERARLLALKYFLEHQKKGFAKHLEQPLAQIGGELSNEVMYHMWLSHKYKKLIVDQKAVHLLTNHWDEALFFTQDLEFFKPMLSAGFSSVMNMHIWHTITTHSERWSEKKIKSFIQAMKLALVHTKKEDKANFIDTLATLFYLQAIDFPKKRSHSLKRALTLSQHSHQLISDRNFFNQQMIRFLIYTKLYSPDLVPSWLSDLSIDWVSSANPNRLEVSFTSLNPVKSWQKLQNKGYVLYALYYDDLASWKKDKFQQQLTHLKLLDQALPHKTTLIRIYIPPHSRLPLQVPHAIYQPIADADTHALNSEAAPLLLAQPPSTFVTSQSDKKPVKIFHQKPISNQLLKQKKFHIIYAHEIDPTPKDPYWTLSLSHTTNL